MQRLACASCGEAYDASVPRVACDCGGLLDLDFKAEFPLGEIAVREPGLWRYAEALPVDVDAAVKIGEPMTPLLPVQIGGREVLIKQEQLFATGSYKDRGSAIMISRARETGVTQVVEDSSGNAGASVAGYCARAGINCSIFVPASTSPGKLAQVSLYGAGLNLVPGSRDDTAKAVLHAAKDAFYASHCYNPYFHHGTKTFAYEVCEQLGWQGPDTVVLPAGNGTLLLGAHIGFNDLVRAGLIPTVPKLVAVQAKGCAPLARAFEQGLAEPAKITPVDTLAEGIAIGEPVRGPQMLKAVRDTGGVFLTVDEKEIKAALLSMGRKGFCIEPTSACTIAGLQRYAEGTNPDEVIVSMFTGHGLKAADKLKKLME